ncbi:NAD(P)/FAD-dependent oxidoreductase [Segnochrobactrum spirostomi]|uniref:FAD-dependent oxidoreductase n=1 Tax=Segnochrobactrum spirostomi TaxID=2608987 RepID=A0A6A7Y770_9HYPH|nr:FAD-dependent oxidoreductase [Segnochrobactrum spirostomi]MQT14157.1 FAD-dependent oxidoreductase [Segnochrobactrum spirostomi]
MVAGFDVVVVGKGMMGAAAARHLANGGAKVTLVGPDEPQDLATHQGVFASHYDAGRITRSIDDDPDWSLLARRSIERYAAIEAESGIAFYAEVGCIIAADDSDYLSRAARAAEGVGAQAARLEAGPLATAFPMLRFPDGYCGLHEARNAGHIDPRALVRAQTALARRAGATVAPVEIEALVDRGTHVEAVAVGGDVFRADKAIIATGGHAIRPWLLPRPLDLTVKARTVFLLEIEAGEQARYDGMPSVIQVAADQEHSFYALPPIRYPDGRVFLKIGGDPRDTLLASEADIRAWFRSGGDPAVARHLEHGLRNLLPGLRGRAGTSAACMTTFTRHGYPYIDFADSDRIVVLTGGNGKAAKSSDEIGRLGAILAAGGPLDREGYAANFEAFYF